jgi:hypothetical protein
MKTGIEGKINAIKRDHSSKDVYRYPSGGGRLALIAIFEIAA